MEKQEDMFLPEFKKREIDIFDRQFPARLKSAPIYDPTKFTILTGDDGILDDLFSYQVYNKIKNHWRAAAAPADRQPGMIRSDSDDDKLHHYGNVGGAAWEEILQLTRSNDVSPQFATVRLMDTGVDHYLNIRCNEDLGANRTLSLIVGDAARTITLAGNPTLHTFTSADWLDQAVKQASSPQFRDITAYKNGVDVEVFIHEDAGTHDAQLHYKRGGDDWYVGLIGGTAIKWFFEANEVMKLTSGGKITLDGAVVAEKGASVAAANMVTALGVAEFLRSTSSKKYKDKIKDLELDSALLYDFQVRSFNSLCEADDKEKRFHGLIADEVEKVCPEIVGYDDHHKAESYDNQMLIALMIKEMQNLNNRIKHLETN